MDIEIYGRSHTKEWLITTPEGQNLLAKAKGSDIRPKCTCSKERPSMYIRTRGDIHYLARMPGTALEHADDCQAHIIPRSVYTDRLQATADILPELWGTAQIKAPGFRRHWAAIRSALYLAASRIVVDDASLSNRLHIPLPFDQDRAKELEKNNLQFYDRSNDDDGGNRYWTLGILKSIAKSKYNHRMLVKHMPRISFWIPNDLASALPTPNKDQMVIVLFVGRPVKSGIAVTDIVGMLVTDEFEPVNRVESGLVLDRVSRVAQALGLPLSTPRREVINALIDRFLEEKCAS